MTTIAYRKFTKDYPEYDFDLVLCAHMDTEMVEAKTEFDKWRTVYE